MNRAQRRRRQKPNNKSRANINTADLPTQLQDAFAAYHAGRRPPAAATCREILKHTPGQVDALHLLGIITHEDGDAKEAARLISQAINLDPAQPSFYNSMGIILKACGKPAEAARCYRAALELAPDDPGVLNNLANTLRDQGRLDEATCHFERALAINPHDAPTHFNMALALEDLGKDEEAIAGYRRALEDDPNYCDVINNLGLLLLKQAKPDEAITHFNRLLEIDPGSADAYNNLGHAHQQRRKLGEAETAYRRAIEIEPDHADAHYNLGLVLREQGQPSEAINYFKRALECNPLLVDAYTCLGEIYEKTHQLAELENHTEKMLQLDPDNPEANWLVARMLRRNGKHKEARQRLSRIQIPTDNDQTTMGIHFEFGRLYDLDHNSDQAFQHFSEGNRLQALSPEAYIADKDRYLRNIRALRDFYTDKWVQSPAAFSTEYSTQAPAFIIGFPRSGTTLLGQILDSHPQVQVLEEKPALESVQLALAEMPDGYPGALAKLSDSDLIHLRTHYFNAAKKYIARNPDLLLVDKHPLNINYVGLITRLFPNAKLVFALRHPCDVCLSCFMQSFRPNDAMVSFFTIKDTAIFYDEVMRLWQQSVVILRPDFHEVRYETLVEDFKTEVAGLLDFLGLEWNDAVMDYNRHAKTQVNVDTPSYSQVTEPIYQRARYRWQRYQRHFEPVMGLLRSHLDYFKY